MLGLDLGTSSCKIGLFDHAGRPRGFGQAAYVIARAPDGQAEQWPDDWWRSVAQAQALMLAPYLIDDPDGAAGAVRVCYGVTPSGGGSLKWYANQFAPDLLAAYGQPLPLDAPARLEAMAAGVRPAVSDQ